jgi:hypothetical protein
MLPKFDKTEARKFVFVLRDIMYFFGAAVFGKKPGLQYSIFLNQILNFIQGLGVENLDIFYSHLVNFMAVWYFLWSFGIFVVFWCMYFIPFWYILPNSAFVYTLIIYNISPDKHKGSI